MDDEEPEMEEDEEQVDDDGADVGGEMDSEIMDDPSGGMTIEGRKRQKRQTMPYMTKYERARILGLALQFSAACACAPAPAHNLTETGFISPYLLHSTGISKLSMCLCSNILGSFCV